MVNLLPRNVRITPNYREEPIEISDITSIHVGNDLVQEQEQEPDVNPLVYRGHWIWSKFYLFFCFLMFFIKITTGVSFFHWALVDGLIPLQMNSQRFGVGLMAWSLNCYFLLPYFSNKNQARNYKDTRISSAYIIGSIVNILGTVVFSIYSHEFNAPGQVFDLLFPTGDKNYRTLLIAMSILCDFAVGLIYGKCEIVSYDPKKDNSRYKLGSFTGYIRDNVYSKNRLDIIHSSCFKIVIRNKGTTPVKFGDSSCVDPTFRSVTSFKVERIVRRLKHFLLVFPYKSTENIDFTVRILKTIPPGEDIIFVPEPHKVEGAFRINGLRAFCMDRGDEVETRIILPYDRFPFLTRVEQYLRTVPRRQKYEENPTQISRDQNSTYSTKNTK